MTPPNERDLSALLMTVHQLVIARLQCLSVPLIVLELADRSHHCVSPQSARKDAHAVAMTLLRQAHHLIGRERFDELVQKTREEFQ